MLDNRNYSLRLRLAGLSVRRIVLVSMGLSLILSALAMVSMTVGVGGAVAAYLAGAILAVTAWARLGSLPVPE